MLNTQNTTDKSIFDNFRDLKMESLEMLKNILRPGNIFAK